MAPTPQRAHLRRLPLSNPNPNHLARSEASRHLLVAHAAALCVTHQAGPTIVKMGSSVVVTKRCGRCATSFPADLEHFGKDSARRDGLHPHCRECRRRVKAKSDAKRQRLNGKELNRRREARRSAAADVARKQRRRERMSAGSFVSPRDAVMEACTYCGTTGGELTVDHVIALVRGGKDSTGNRTAACRRCNGSKGSRVIAEWVRHLVEIGSEPPAGGLLSWKIPALRQAQQRVARKHP